MVFRGGKERVREKERVFASLNDIFGIYKYLCVQNSEETVQKFHEYFYFGKKLKNLKKLEYFSS